jgi:hypothetical protein
LKPGTLTHIALDQHLTQNLKKPNSDCLNNNDKDWFKQFDNSNKNLSCSLIKNGIYSQSFCLLLCEKLNKGDPINDCDKDIKPEFVYQINFNISSDNCSKLCPKQCENLAYYCEYFQTDYPSNFYSQIILKSQLAERNKLNSSQEVAEFLSNILHVKVYYKKSTYIMTIEVLKVTFNDLLASLGGEIGLCLGNIL